MKKRFLSTLVGVFTSFYALGQLQVLDDTGKPHVSGVVVSLETYEKVPASGTFNWSL